jgi:hypothetical protein
LTSGPSDASPANFLMDEDRQLRGVWLVCG